MQIYSTETLLHARGESWSYGPKRERILSNPPWVRYNEIHAEERRNALESLARELGLWVGGKYATSFDIAACFILKCAENFLAPGGKAAWLANVSSLNGGHWKKFREIFEKKPLLAGCGFI